MFTLIDMHTYSLSWHIVTALQQVANLTHSLPSPITHHKVQTTSSTQTTSTSSALAVVVLPLATRAFYTRSHPRAWKSGDSTRPASKRPLPQKPDTIFLHSTHTQYTTLPLSKHTDKYLSHYLIVSVNCTHVYAHNGA